MRKLKVFFIILIFLISMSHKEDPVNNTAEIQAHLLKDDGTFPNNKLPLLLYKNALNLPEKDAAAIVENVFKKNNWQGTWRNGIYGYHHYHSTAHEVLGIYSGRASVQFGGPDGIKAEVEKGDAIIIPAGVAHKNLDSSDDFACVGAYPQGQTWDMNYGKEEERPQADKHIEQVEVPATDPIFGKKAGILKQWK